MGPGQLDDVGGQLRLVIGGVRRLAVGGTVLAQHLAGAALGHAEPALHSLHAGAAASGA